MTGTTWDKELRYAMAENKDEGPVVAKLPDDESVWQLKFNPGWGSSEGQPVVAWTEKHVYFPVCYDGSEWLGTAPRNPGGEPLYHQGGQ